MPWTSAFCSPAIDARFDLLFDSGQVPNLTCTGTRSIPFPFRPRSELKEVLAWLTDVNEAYDGKFYGDHYGE